MLPCRRHESFRPRVAATILRHAGLPDLFFAAALRTLAGAFFACRARRCALTFAAFAAITPLRFTAVFQRAMLTPCHAMILRLLPPRYAGVILLMFRFFALADYAFPERHFFLRFILAERYVTRVADTRRQSFSL